MRGTTRPDRPRRRRWLPAMPAMAAAALILGMGATAGSAPSAPARRAAASGLGKIQHVVIIMQENRSFDSYFGTFPGADGIPMSNGVPTVCAPDPKTGQCVAPFRDSYDLTQGGPHGAVAATA